MTNEQKKIKEEKNLITALCELHTCAHRDDITQTAADLKLSVDHVRRHLRGLVWDLETGREIYNHLRALTLVRTHCISTMLSKVA